MKRIVADPAKCLACRACEIACAMAHTDTDDLMEAFAQGAKPRIYIESAGSFAVPLQCRHCDDAPCIRVCPSGALGRESEAAPVLADQQKCIGCAFCVQACPFGVIQVTQCSSLDSDNGRVAVIKCDLCMDEHGENPQPACVASCPVGALTYDNVDEDAKRNRRRTAAQVIVGTANG